MKKLGMIVVLTVLLASCGTKKIVTQESNNVTTTTPVVSETKDNVALEQRKLSFVRKVVDNAVYAKDISSKMDFTMKSGEKEITVSGRIYMRKDEVIRIQLQAPILGMEVGRLEFTKDYVMIVDKLHTQYVKADYSQVDFLQNNGITFYSLQSLFWNELFMPGVKKVDESHLSNYDVTLGQAATCPIVLKRDNMVYTWTTDSQTGLIQQADVSYTSAKHGTTKMSCLYNNFKALGVKQFPYELTLNMNTTATKKAKNATINIKMKNISTDGDWQSFTSLSKKYEQVSVEDVLEKLMSF